MIGKIIGAIAGSQASKHIRGIDGTGGALLGAALPVVLRRLGPLGIVTAAAAGYAFKKYNDRRHTATPLLPNSGAVASPTRTQA